MILPKEFYEDDAITVAKNLLGKVLVRKVDGKVIKCKIVETESYIGAIDKASHAYNGRRTERTEPLFHSGGISYVYFIYGLYHCFNVISDKENVASGVLIRAVEPLNNFDYLAEINCSFSIRFLISLYFKSLISVLYASLASEILSSIK